MWAGISFLSPIQFFATCFYNKFYNLSHHFIIYITSAFSFHLNIIIRCHLMWVIVCRSLSSDVGNCLPIVIIWYRQLFAELSVYSLFCLIWGWTIPVFKYTFNWPYQACCSHLFIVNIPSTILPNFCTTLCNYMDSVIATVRENAYYTGSHNLSPVHHT